METRAALLREQPGQWQVETVELDEPHEQEVLLRVVAAGLCHSDEHFAQGESPAPKLPMCGGHEGAGVIEAVGPDVARFAPGDHVVTAFMPSCGHCRWCASGQQNLCDSGGGIAYGAQMDGTFRMHSGGVDIAQNARLGMFSEYTVVSAVSCVKIPRRVPLRAAALLGCGVPTGWGSAVRGAGVGPGDTVVVMGVGGIGVNAVQGAALAGASHVIAVDPVLFKRETALRLGATRAFATIAEGADFARSVTGGQGADAAIVAVGSLEPADFTDAAAAIRKGGTVVVTGLGKRSLNTMVIPFNEFVLFQKRLQGALYGMCSPDRDVPRLIALYESGQLKLDELITATYTLDQINEGYADLRAGRNIRGLIVHDNDDE